MNMEETVLNILKGIIATKSSSYDDSISADTKLREDLGLTSFDLAELTVKIEDEFDIDIFEDGLVNTVGEIYAKLSK